LKHLLYPLTLAYYVVQQYGSPFFWLANRRLPIRSVAITRFRTNTSQPSPYHWSCHCYRSLSKLKLVCSLVLLCYRSLSKLKLVCPSLVLLWRRATNSTYRICVIADCRPRIQYVVHDKCCSEIGRVNSSTSHPSMMSCYAQNVSKVKYVATGN
jgi:hypothetical protein